ncbi:MAG TPA: FAD-binding protein [Candidatus Thermoplasmatota archaeon]|nr:FAD-binding protein [Candidatus Thermoplasmatota archaeon]
MDLLELALNPRKAAQRMSPFFNELPKGQARKLEYYFGDRASDDIAERVLYSRDASQPPTTLNLLLKRNAWAVVRPQVRGELLELLQFAKQNGVPLTPRGAGTSGYGGSVPTEGGVVVDMRGFNKVLQVDKAAGTVRVEGNVTFYQLEQALVPHGFALRQYPTSYHAATVAGWLAQGGGGVGSAKYGPFRNDIVSVTLLSPEGKEYLVEGEDLDLVSETFGGAGFIVEVTLKVRKVTALTHFYASFESVEAAQVAARRALLEARPYHVTLVTQEYAELVNKAAGSKLLPNKAGVLVTLESSDAAQQVEQVKGIMLTGGGSAAKDTDAQRIWDNRFNHLNLKRLGPSVVVAETIVAAEKLPAAMEAASAAGKLERACLWAIAVSPTEFDLIYYGLDDERRGTYPLAMGNALAVIDAVKGVGGRSYSTGVLASNEAKAVLGKERIKKLNLWRKKTDKKEIFNPGVVTGPRTRLMPLPVHDFALQMKIAGPMLKVQRGVFPTASDPQFEAMQRALGRVHAGRLGELAQTVTSCIFCGMCNAYSPEGRTTPWESATPRGRVQLAKAVIEGRATLSPRVHRNVAWTALEHMPDAVCPVAIPIQRVTDLLLAACVQQFGPLPEQAGLAEQYAGKDRSKWMTMGFDPVSTTMFLADDVATFEANDVAQGAAMSLLGAGYPVGHLGKDDAGSAAALFETGQRVAAEAAIAPLLEKLAKRNVRTLVTPDANAARAIALDWPLVASANEVEVPAGLHTSTVLLDLLKGKKLEIDADKKLTKKAVVHVPEGLTAAQRAAVTELAKAVAATVVPCEHQECGQGRALKMLDETLAASMAERCLKAAMSAGAEVVLTMSPGCYQSLKTTAKKAKAGVEVMDLHVVIAGAMKASGGMAMAAPVAAQAPSAPVEPVIGPDQFRVEFVKEGVVLAVGKNQNILEAGADAGLDLPSSCKAGSCDTCSARWEGAAPDQSAGSALNAEQQKTYVLTCIARPKGPVKIWSDERPK